MATVLAESSYSANSNQATEKRQCRKPDRQGRNWELMRDRAAGIVPSYCWLRGDGCHDGSIP
jgi:hypothetical protein